MLHPGYLQPGVSQSSCLPGPGTVNMRIRTHDEQGTATRSTSNNAECRSVTFDVAVDRRVRTNVADINIIGKKCLYECRTRIEGLRLQVNVWTKGILKCATCYPN